MSRVIRMTSRRSVAVSPIAKGEQRESGRKIGNLTSREKISPPAREEGSGVRGAPSAGTLPWSRRNHQQAGLGSTGLGRAAGIAGLASRGWAATVTAREERPQRPRGAGGVAGASPALARGLRLR